MTSKLAKLIEAGKSLDADEREIVALALQQVDQAEQAEIDAAWDETIDRRLDELTSGTVAPARLPVASPRRLNLSSREP